MLIRIVMMTALLVLLGQGSVYAADKSVEVGAFQFLPSLGISRTRDDNIFAQPGTVDRDTITRYQPEIQLYGRQDDNSYSFTYEGDFGRYDKYADDDYDDHAFMMDLKFDGGKNDLDVSTTFGKFHERRGEGLSEGPFALLRPRYDRYDYKNVAGVWELGADTRFSVQVAGERSDIEYTNNLLITEFLSRQEEIVTGRLYVRAGPAKIFLDYSRKNIVYDIDIAPGITLDSKEDTSSIGVEWYVTEKTKGVVKGGKTQKDFEFVAPGFEQFDLNSWEVEATWSPVTYSAFTLSSGRYIRETNGTGLFFVVRENELRWKHNFTDNISISLSASQGQDFFQNSLRVDDRQGAGFLFEYDIKETLNIGFGFHFTDLDSSDDLFDYDREEYFIELTLH